MKKITIISIFLFSVISNAQIVIEKENLRSEGSILEFNDMKEPNGSAKGIILPILKDSSRAMQGALWVDAKTKKVMYKSKDKSVELTEQANVLIPIPEGDNIPEAGVIVADDSMPEFSKDPAIFKLDSKKAALLLPYVQDVTKDISNPEPGTIAYDAKSKSLAIFNGNYWYFWN
ncbi:hypothetical protein EDL98_02570 [Ornithobacterium rhinotracheale]|uniref:hypothetical protein n=1 Tax=Ornithobacterium rhinotracheale TaxID=28251 RepID=UPI00129C69A8|nr:hypothetical protein [Ornithobacterium rhinotracheale]MRJ09967.1 hypothetical protein [Ornithobacterium rhinotracheale]